MFLTERPPRNACHNRCRILDPFSVDKYTPASLLERIIDLLNRLIQNDSESLCILETLYDNYCGGFTFLRYIALYFITTIDEYKASLINDLVKLQEYIFPIKREADRLLAFLRNGELSIISEDDYFGNRTEADRKEIHSINEMMNDNRKT